MTLVPVHPRDRLGIMMVLAIIAHGIIILGVSFDIAKFEMPESPIHALDIILVHQSSEQAPEKADFLAQANQEGGGESDEAVRPSSPVSSSRQLPESGIAPETRMEQRPRTQPESRQQILTRKGETAGPQSDTDPEPVEYDKATASELVEQSLEVARMSAEIDATINYQGKRTRNKYISASTREFGYASYMDAWRRKVERIGNLNYPAEAIRRQLHGSLILDVALNPDGSILEIKVVQSSGEDVLDNAAKRIVELAAPYAAFPDHIREETDVLHIIRTWQFMADNRLFSKP